MIIVIYLHYGYVLYWYLCMMNNLWSCFLPYYFINFNLFIVYEIQYLINWKVWEECKILCLFLYTEVLFLLGYIYKYSFLNDHWG